MTKEPSRRHPAVPDDAASDRLDSSKDVATYLRRDVTTVQLGTPEGAADHRHLHAKQGSVHAFGSELDAWQRTCVPEPLRRERALANADGAAETLAAVHAANQ